jgi:hypothetical protein
MEINRHGVLEYANTGDNSEGAAFGARGTKPWSQSAAGAPNVEEVSHDNEDNWERPTLGKDQGDLRSERNRRHSPKS